MQINKFINEAIDLIGLYLSYRNQDIIVQGRLSEFIWIIYGNSQGSILGPFLFNLYVNELSAVMNILCGHEEYYSEELLHSECNLCGIMTS